MIESQMKKLDFIRKVVNGAAYSKKKIDVIPSKNKTP